MKIMKHKLSKLLSLVLITTFIVGCKQNNAPTSSSQEAEIIADKYIVENSRSTYSIVLPKNPKNKEQLAANTLSEYLYKSTGARLSIVSEREVIKGDHYISLGNTAQFNEAFADVSMSELDNKISSYFISTKNDNIYIYSNPHERGEAIAFGVCDLLHELVDYTYYASDEIYYKKETSINLRKYDNFFIHPSFDGRAIGNLHTINNQDTCDNLRILNQYRGTEWASSIYGHSQISAFVKPQDLYFDGRPLYEAHPEWFTNKSAVVADTTNNQLCWSAGESLVEYVAYRFTQYFQQYPEATYFMFGQEDNHVAFCRCEKCVKAMLEEAVNYAGLQIAFMNKVIAKTEAWLEENQPGRQVRYVVYAYYATKNAPCVQRDGKWVAANDYVKPHSKLFIFYAPITCNFAFPLDNNNFNSDTYLELQQWSQVAAGHLIIYFYDVNFRYYFANYANFGTVKSMYKYCKDIGAVYMYTQGATDSITGCFNEMREYVESSLMWNIDLDYEVLAKDFIDHYFYDAAPEIYEYYQMVRDRLAAYHASQGDGGTIYTNISNKNIYPYSVLRYYVKLFKTAVEKISHYQNEDNDFYFILKGRIMREYLSVIYLTMTLCKADVSDQEKAEMKEIFQYYSGFFGIMKSVEGGTTLDIDALFA